MQHKSLKRVHALAPSAAPQVSEELNKHFGREVSTFYHAGSEQQMREIHQNAWSRGKVSIMCATIAFGACW